MPLWSKNLFPKELLNGLLGHLEQAGTVLEGEFLIIYMISDFPSTGNTWVAMLEEKKKKKRGSMYFSFSNSWKICKKYIYKNK